MALVYRGQDISTCWPVGLIFWALAVVPLVPASGLAGSHPSDAKKARLVWEVRLDADPDFRLHFKNLLLEPASISFLDEGNLVLSFHDGTPSPFPVAETEFGYHALFLDAQNGTIRRRMMWKTKNDNSLILPTGGGFLLLTGQKLTLYNPEFQATNEMDIPAKPRPGWPRSDFWSAARCLDSKVFVLAHTLDRSTTYQWLTIPDFKQLGTAELQGFDRFSCTETQIAKAWVPNIMMTTIGNAFVPSCNGCKAYRAEFLDSEHMITLKRHDFQVLTTSWYKMGGGKLENTVQIVSNAPAAGTFALGSTTITGGEWIFTIRIFNWKTAQMLTTMSFRKKQLQRGWDRGFNDLGLALSPDGSRFVVFKDGVLEMYVLE